MFSNRLFAFGKRFYSTKPVQPRRSKLKWALGLFGTVAVTSGIVIHMHDKALKDDLKDNPYKLKFMFFPSRETCLTVMEDSSYAIRCVPWYHLKGILLERPYLIDYMRDDDWGVLDVSKELVKLNHTNIKYCFETHCSELFKLISDENQMELATQKTEYAKYMDCNTNEKTNFIENLVTDNYKNIVHCPENRVDKLLLLIPSEYFADPNNFTGLVLSGHKFNEYFAKKNRFFKVTNYNEIHNELKLQDGLVVDPKPFLRNDDCNGGIYFSHLPGVWAFKYCCNVTKCHLREVIVPNDAIVKIEYNKIKADKILLLHPITDRFHEGFNYGELL